VLWTHSSGRSIPGERSQDSVKSGQLDERFQDIVLSIRVKLLAAISRCKGRLYNAY
jgi:hypothetical protein